MAKLESKVERLVGAENWQSWKFDIDLHLTVHKVRRIVTGDWLRPAVLEEGATAEAVAAQKKEEAAFEEADGIVRYLIGCSVSGEVKQHILTSKNGKEMWDTLHSIFEQKNERRLDMLYSQLFSYVKDPADTIAVHVSKLQKIWQDLQDELKTDNVKLPESMLLNRVLNTLPVEYLEFKNAWESSASGDRTLTRLTERLRLHEQRLEELKVGSQVALVSVKKSAQPWKAGKGSDSQRKGSDSQRKGSECSQEKGPRCFKCKLVGHFKKDCPKLKDDKKANGQVFINVSEKPVASEWFIDSGASYHVVNTSKFFRSYRPFPQPQALLLGDGHRMYAYGEGEIDVQMLVHGQWEDAVLSKVWLVPASGQNLFSCGKALDKDLVEVANKKIREFRTHEGKTVAVGIRQNNGVYKLLMRVVSRESSESNEAVAYAASEGLSLQVWNERLGHQDKSHVQNLLKNKGIKVSGTEKELCEACIYGKMHRLKFGTRKDRGEKPGERVSADICGPMPVVSKGGARYFLLFKDDYSKYRVAYILKKKSDVAEKLEEFLAEAKTKGHQVEELLTDGGTEFVNAETAKILRKYGVHHRVTMAYTPEQNGAIERDNRTLVEAARTMLLAANLEEQLWAEAISTAVYIINRTGPTPVGETPYKLWHGKDVVIEHLKIFGTECFIHIPKQKCKKFDKKALRGFLVGYCENKDGYRVYVPDKGEVILSRDVVFKEAFPSVVIDVPESSPDEVSVEETEQVVVVDDSSNEEGQQEEDRSPSTGYGLRNKRDIKIPERYDDFVMLALHDDEPRTYKEAISSENSGKWKEAMNDEMASLRENDVWELVDLPQGQKVIKNKWVYKVKKQPDGAVQRFKDW